MKFIAGCFFYVVGTLAVVALVLVSCRPTDEQLSVSGTLVPPTVPGQTVGAAYMQLLSTRNAALVKVDTDVASTVEIHQMTMDNNIMRMQRLDSLELPAGKAVTLKTGGTHLMLLDLKRPLKTGDTVNLTLTLRLGQGRYAQEQVVAKVGRSVKTEGQ